MKPRPGSLRHRLRLFLYRCGVAYDGFVRRPRVHQFSTITAHFAPMIAVVVGAYMIAREFLFSSWKHPAVSILILVVLLGMVFAQITHRPDTCRRCLRRMPWGKDRIHAGRAMLMASYHATVKIELVAAAFLGLFLISEYVTLPRLLAWADDERTRSVGLHLLMMILVGWIGQANMTHRIYRRSCKRCRTRRRGGGGPNGDGGEPIPLPVAEPHRKSA